MKKFCNGFILLFLMLSLSTLTAAVCYASDDPAYDKAYEVYQNQGGIQGAAFDEAMCGERQHPGYVDTWLDIHSRRRRFRKRITAMARAWLTKYMRAPGCSGKGVCNR